MRHPWKIILICAAAVAVIAAAICVPAFGLFSHHPSAYDILKQSVAGDISGISITAGGKGCASVMIKDAADLRSVRKMLSSWQIKPTNAAPSHETPAYTFVFYSAGKEAGTLKIFRAQNDLLTINGAAYAPRSQDMDYSMINELYNRNSPLDIKAFEEKYLTVDYTSSMDRKTLSALDFSSGATTAFSYRMINCYPKPGVEGTYMMNYIAYDRTLEKAVCTVAFTVKEEYGAFLPTAVKVVYCDGLYIGGTVRTDFAPPYGSSNVVLNDRYLVYREHSASVERLSLLDTQTLQVVRTVSVSVGDKDAVASFRKSGDGMLVVTSKKAVRYDAKLNQTGSLKLPAGGVAWPYLHSGTDHIVWDVSDDLSTLCYETKAGLFLSGPDLKKPVTVKLCNDLTDNENSLVYSYGRAQFVDGSKKVLFYKGSNDICDFAPIAYLYNIGNGVLYSATVSESHDLIVGEYINNRLLCFCGPSYGMQGPQAFSRLVLLDPDKTDKDNTMQEVQAADMPADVICSRDGYRSYTNGKIVAFTYRDYNGDASFLYIYTIKTKTLKKICAAGGKYEASLYAVLPDNRIILTYSHNGGAKSGAIVYSIP